MTDTKDAHFFSDPDVDRLLSMVLALAGEVSVLHDRLDTHERLAAEGDVPTPERVAAFDVSPELAAERERWRTRYLRRVMAQLSAEMARYAGGARGTSAAPAAPPRDPQGAPGS